MSRRKLLVTASVGALLAVKHSTAFAQTPADGSWSFSDDKGVEIVLEQPPVRIVADLMAAAALWDFGIRPIGVFGWDVNPDGTFTIAGGRIDPAAVEKVGNSVEPLNVEQTAALNPDLIVTLTDGSDDPQLYWSIDPSIVDTTRMVAPILAIDTSVRLDLVVSRFAELAAALGADLETDESSDLRSAAEEAATAFSEGVSQKPGLTALFLASSESELYIANPKVAPDLIYFRELGLTMPDLDVADTDYWEILSWEESIKYPVDLIFFSTRIGLKRDELKAHPVFGKHPTVLADQLEPWNGEEPYSYQGLATTLTNTLASIQSAVHLS